MRTTLDIDLDVLHAVRDVAAQERTTLGHVVSDLVREALNASTRSPATSDDGFLGFVPLPRRGAVVSNDLVNAIRADEGI